MDGGRTTLEWCNARRDAVPFGLRAGIAQEASLAIGNCRVTPLNSPSRSGSGRAELWLFLKGCSLH